MAEQAIRAGQSLGIPYSFTVARAFFNPSTRVKDAVLTSFEQVGRRALCVHEAMASTASVPHRTAPLTDEWARCGWCAPRPR